MSEAQPDRDADSGARLAVAARRRLAAAAADLRLPDSCRLSEWQRRSVSALLAGLARSVEDELRSALAARFVGGPAGDGAHDMLHAALTSAHVEIALPLLDAAAPWEPALIAILLRRAEEHRLHRGNADNALLTELAGNADEAIAAEAMVLLIAQSRRLDSFQEPMIRSGELPAEQAHALAWTIAAALRRYMLREHGIAAEAADAALGAAAASLLAGHDEGATFEAQSLRLARILHCAGALDDGMAARMLIDGNLPLFLAALHVRTGLAAEACWELLSDPSAAGSMLLLRGAGFGRDVAGAILFRLHGEGERAIAAFERFEGLGAAEAAARLGLWRADPAYRAAVARLAA